MRAIFTTTKQRTARLTALRALWRQFGCERSRLMAISGSAEIDAIGGIVARYALSIDRDCRGNQWRQPSIATTTTARDILARRGQYACPTKHRTHTGAISVTAQAVSAACGCGCSDRRPPIGTRRRRSGSVVRCVGSDSRRGHSAPLCHRSHSRRDCLHGVGCSLSGFCELRR